MQIDANILRSVIAWWDDSGVDVPVIKPAPKPRRVLQSKAALKRAQPQPIKPASAKPSDSKPANDAIEAAKVNIAQIAAAAPNLDALKTAIDKFDAGDLSVNATQAVFARGSSQAKIMIIGEAPTREDDSLGLPMMGTSGTLLDKMLAAIGLSEDSAYISTVCNWRPLSARGPSPDEIALGIPLIKRHIELAAPSLLVLAGSVPLEALTGVKGMMKSRGQWQTVTIGGRDIPAMPLYHPDFLLKNPELKRDAWYDLVAIKQKLESV